MNKQKISKRNTIIQIILFFALIAIDQLTKLWVVNTLKDKDPVVFIKGIIEFQYLENNGAAFGFLQNKQWFFYIITLLVFGVIIYFWIKSNKAIYKYAQLDTSIFKTSTFNCVSFMNYILVIIASGAIGNLIDRIAHKYVVDFIYFKIINFPIFNFADICVTVGAVMLIIVCLFKYKEDPNFTIFKKKEK